MITVEAVTKKFDGVTAVDHATFNAMPGRVTGIRWMRDLLRGHADRGGTVLLSSHLLHEIEMIADDIVVIGKGRIVAQGNKSDLLVKAGTLVRTTRPDDLQHALIAHGETATVTGEGTVRTEAAAEVVGRIALQAGVSLTELRPAGGTGLEEMFFALTSDTQRGGAAA